MPIKYQPREKTTRPCVICGKPATGRADVKTCSYKCRYALMKRDREAAAKK